MRKTGKLLITGAAVAMSIPLAAAPALACEGGLVTSCEENPNCFDAHFHDGYPQLIVNPDNCT
jgi:hypothetical protein